MSIGRRELSKNQNKREIAKLIRLLLEYRGEISEYLIDSILTILLWAATERDDSGKNVKYFGQRYWSRKAIKKRLDNEKEIQKGKKIKFITDLRHEHTIPKKIIINELKKKTFSEKEILNILRNKCISSVITKEEHKKLDELGFRKKIINEDNFSRYKKAKIKICDVVGIDLMKIKRFPKNIKSLT